MCVCTLKCNVCLCTLFGLISGSSLGEARLEDSALFGLCFIVRKHKPLIVVEISWLYADKYRIFCVYGHSQAPCKTMC